jgi:IS5 family transposase
MRQHKMTMTDYDIQNRLSQIEHFLLEFKEMVNWDKVKKYLEPLDPQRTKVAGRDSYDPVKMFRVMLLQGWYDLSDPEMEFYLRTNLLFMNFCDFSITESTPDHSTISRWRDRLTKSGLYKTVFEGIMGEFHEMGLEVKKGKMVDATLITSQARPRKKVYIETEPTGDEAQSEESTPTFEATDVTVEESVDQDAHWMKKGNQSTYGYKGHVLTDSNGIVENIIVTPANVHDTVRFPDLIFNTALEEGDIIHADKGYHSEANKELLRNNNLVDKIMHKRKRNEAEDDANKQRNKAISQHRYVIERTFGSLKRSYGWSRSRYLGLEKTTCYLYMRCLAYNIKRAMKILSLSPA